jgi:hypothetical protein
MTDKNAESMKHLNEGERIAILSDKLVEAFGADACDVIERQIEGHDSDETRATWIAVWESLCAPEARRA